MKSKKCNTIKILKNAVKALIMPVAVYLIFTAVTVGRFGSWAVIVTVLRTTVVPMLIAMAMSMPMNKCSRRKKNRLRKPPEQKETVRAVSAFAIRADFFRVIIDI